MKQTLYHNGTILTMGDPLYTQAVLVEDGRVKRRGSFEHLSEQAGEDCVLYDLRGHTLMPAFLDTYGHFSAFSQSLGFADLSECRNHSEIGETLRRFARRQKIDPQKDWVVGLGYGNLEERTHPSRALLDQVLPEYRVLACYADQTRGVLSAKGLDAAFSGQRPSGLQKYTDGTFTGLAKGTLFDQAFEQACMRSSSLTFALLERAQSIYVHSGITTIQESHMQDQEWGVVRMFAESPACKLDINCYVDAHEYDSYVTKAAPYLKSRVDGLRLCGCRIPLDGALLDQTARLTKVHPDQPLFMPDEDTLLLERELPLLLFEARMNEVQPVFHCAGDQAVDLLLDACAPLEPDEIAPLRPVLVHGQVLRSDQVEKLAEYGFFLSFCASEIYAVGARLEQTLHSMLVPALYPIGAAHAAGNMVTLHQNAPNFPPDPLLGVWCAVNRLTQEEQVLGPGDKLSVLEALRAVTSNAARQTFEEDEKGQIMPGMLANFVVLDRDPLAVDPLELASLHVLSTIKEDVPLF